MKTIAHICYREWKRIFTIPTLYVILVILPLILYPFYAYIYDARFVKDNPVAIWDEDHSSISHQITDMLEKSAGIKFVTNISSEQQMANLAKTGEVNGFVHFPKNFERDIKYGKPTVITIYSNTSALVGAKMIYKDAAATIIKAGLAVVMQKNEKLGMQKDQVNTLIQPIKLNTFTKYNEGYNYQKSLAPGLVTVGIQMAIILAAVILLNLEFKTKTMADLIRVGGRSAFKIIIGKALAVQIVSWYIFLLVFLFVLPLFGIENNNRLADLFVLYNVLVCACTAVGLSVSAATNSIMTAADVGLFYTSPAFVFSGFTFPRWAMPWYDQYYAILMPYTHFMDGFVKIYYMDLPIRYAYRELCCLTIFVAVGFGVATLLYQYKLKKWHPDETPN